MLNPARSGGDRANDESYEAFEKGGVKVQWSNPNFYVHAREVDCGGRQDRASSRPSISIRSISLWTRDYGHYRR